MKIDDKDTLASSNTSRPQSALAARATQMPIMDIVMITLRHWPWMLVSIAVCLGAAWLYLQHTPDVYTRSADIMIRDDKKGNSTSGMEDFADFGLLQSNTDITNEINTLLSKDMMLEVVQRLGLDVEYSRPGALRSNVLYGPTLPVKVEFPGLPAEGSASMNLNVKGGKVTISDLEIDGVSVDGTFTGQLNHTISLPHGAVVVSAAHPGEKIGSNIEMVVNKLPLSVARARYSAGLTVTHGDKDGTMIHLAMSDQSNERADDILKTLINVYNEHWINDKNQVAVSTSNFINERLGVIEGELGNVDNDISSFKSEHLIPDVNAAAAMYTAQAQEISTEIQGLNHQLQMARYIRSNLNGDGARERLLPANTGITDMNIQGGISEYNELVMRRNQLVGQSSEKNPLVQQTDEQMNGLRASIISGVDNYIVALESKIQTLRATASEATAKLASNPGQAKYLLSVERQQKVKEALYLFLLQKREENELSQAFTAYNTRIVNSPGASGIPPTPARGKIMLMAGLLGLLVPFGVTYVAEAMNTRIRGRKDLDGIAVPLLGEIPVAGGRRGARASKKESSNGETPHLIVRPGKRDLVNEALRVVRTNLSFMSHNEEAGRADTIAITSFNPGSGKSFIAMNLGCTMSLKGKNVLVIDGDMRRCTTSSYVGSPKRGLSDYLAGGETDIHSLIVEAPDTKHLFVLPVGTLPPNPAELLESQKFPQMLEQLRGMFDTIIVDCPPIEVVADTQIISRYVDRTVFIVRAGLFERSMLSELERLYTAKKYPNMSLILNGTMSRRGRYGNSYTYGYGYAYGGKNYGSYASGS